MIVVNPCMFCAHLQDFVDKTCAAFPDGIPSEVWRGVTRHNKPLAGDHGLQFKPDGEVPAEFMDDWFNPPAV